MNKYILLILFLIPFYSFSQTRNSAQEKRDKKRLDSLCRKAPSLCSSYGMLVGPRSIFYDLQETKLKPKERHCFDKKINYRGLINNKPVEGCYYVNTNDGMIAKRDDNNSCLGLSNFTAGYKMSQFSMLGDAYIYEIDNRGNKRFRIVQVMEDWEDDVNTTFTISDYNAYNQFEAEKLTDQNLPTYSYKILESSQNSLYHIFAPYRAEKIPVHDYLGIFGTGYYKDQYGNTVMCLLKQSDNENYIRIEKITEVNECFDGSDFLDKIEETSNAEREISDRIKKNIENRKKDTPKTNCDARAQLIILEEKMQNQSDKAVDIAKSGKRLSATDISSLLAGNNVVDEVDKKILELKVKLCNLNELISSPNTSAKAKEKYSAEIDCINSSITKMTTLKTELQAVGNTTNTKEKGRAMVEQNRIYMSRMGQIDLGCNAGKNGQIKSMPIIKNPIPDSKNPIKNRNK